MRKTAVERCAGEIVLAFGDRQLGLAMPALGGFVVLLLLLFEQMLVGDGDGHLGFYLEQLIFHIEKKLTQRLLRILRFVDQVVYVRAEQG